VAVADESRWKYVITDLAGGQPSGTGMIANASSKTFGYNINSARTASATMTVDNPVADYCMSNDALMKVYRRNRLGNFQLYTVGDVTVSEEDGDGNSETVTLSCTDGWFRMKRALGVTNDSFGRGIPYYYGLLADQVTPAPVEIGEALLITLAILNAYSYSGVTPGASTGATYTSYGPVYSMYFSDIIQQSCAVLGGPDFEFEPCEPVITLYGVQIATLNFYSHLGTIDPNNNAVFEYGTGKKSMATYKRVRTKANIANNVLSLPQGYPTVTAAGDHLVQKFDPASVAAIGEFDYILENDNLVTIPMRTLLAQNALAILKQQQEQITFTPSVDCPVEFDPTRTVDGSYGMGDIVQARAYSALTGKLRFNGTARVYGVNFTVDENDAETATLTLIPQTVG
jgi:hypothetical protein